MALSGVRKTLNRLESMSQPSTTFRSSNFPSALCLVMLTIGSRLLGSFVSIGLNRVSSISGTACFILSALSSWSKQAWMKSSIKLSVMMSLGGSGTSRSSAWPNGMSLGSLHGGKSRSKVECRSGGFHDEFVQRSCARSPAMSLTQLNFDGAGVEPKGTRFKR